MNRLNRSLFPSVAVVAFLITSGFSHAQDTIGFNQDVKPILSQTCFKCHGFDAKTREADLRLDTAEGALATRSDGRVAIAPGRLEESLVWQRITSNDPDVVMPPPSSNRQLSPTEKETLQRWIEQGAKYEKHWSLEPIGTEAQALSIDGSLNREMEKQGLVPNGKADPVTLVRRLAFTLTGLPPAPDEVRMFLEDPSRANYEKLVDLYLQSPHYGEEMAKHWLDVARYGDTHGLHLDNVRTMWAYRDWVIQAFNRNLPFDQFTIEQLAGDLLPNPTTDQLTATGFNRCNVTTSEGGAISDEFLFRYAVDRTSTTIQTWLGMTGGCAVCHDHKYDPLSTKEFYSLYAFFYSAADPAMDGNISETRPYFPLATDEQKQRIESAKQQESEAQASLLKSASEIDSRQPWKVTSDSKPSPKMMGSAVWVDDELPIGSKTRNTTRNPEVWVASDSAPMGKRFLTQAFGSKYDQTATGGWPSQVIPESGKLQFWVQPDRFETPKAIYVSIKAGNKTQRWVWADSLEVAKRAGGNPEKLEGPLPTSGAWTQMTIALSELPAGASVQEIQFGLFGGICSWDGFVCTGIYDQESESFRDWWQKQKGNDFPIASGKLAEAIKAGPDSEVGKKSEDEVEDYYYAFEAKNVSTAILERRQAWRRARIERATLESEVAGTMIFNDMASPREAFVMKRGQYDAKGDPVQPDTPSVLPPLSRREPDRPANRLDLARWIVSEANPLTPRVTINRFWQQVFGLGLVASSDDFGTQGTPPSHPKLFDHLADDFRKNGWNVKRLMKQLVMTDAFQRSAAVSDSAIAKDPSNKYLARGPRMRLDAEQIRDNVLASSGILNRGMGGPGFKGYQPPNIWEPVGYGDSNTRYYLQDHGESIYRRSIYAFIKRTAPPPFMTNFDAPNREQFCTRRERSNTPLQALQLLNDIQYVEAARVYAERLWSQLTGNERDRVIAVFENALSRKPTETEFQKILDFYNQTRDRFSKEPEDARRLVAMGEIPNKQGLPAHEIAALTMLINLVFNLDEFVNRN